MNWVPQVPVLHLGVLTSRLSHSTPKNRHSTREFNHSLNNASVTVLRMVIFRMLLRRVLEIRADLPPFGPTTRPPWRAPHTSTPATGQAVCKLVKLRAPADTCISFTVNLSSALRLRRGPTERHISHLFSCSSRLFPSRRTGIPPPSILFSALLPGVRSASARIARFYATSPLLATLAHFMGGGGI